MDQAIKSTTTPYSPVAETWRLSSRNDAAVEAYDTGKIQSQVTGALVALE